MSEVSTLIGAASLVATAVFPQAGLVLALLKAAAAAEPLIEPAIPAVEALFSGQQPTSKQHLALWTAICAIEDKNAPLVAAIEGDTAAIQDPQPEG